MNAIFLAVLAVAQGMDFGQQDNQQQPAPQSKPATGDTSPGLQTEGVKKARFNEVEHGFWLRLPVGVMSYLQPVANTSTFGDKSKKFWSWSAHRASRWATTSCRFSTSAGFSISVIARARHRGRTAAANIVVGDYFAI